MVMFAVLVDMLDVLVDILDVLVEMALSLSIACPDEYTETPDT